MRSDFAVRVCAAIALLQFTVLELPLFPCRMIYEHRVAAAAGADVLRGNADEITHTYTYF
jgi:hypothetical protein